MCKISACPNSNFASYRINIKKKLLNFNLSDAPYVREAIQQVNRNIDLIILNILNVNDYYGYEIVKLAKEISNGSIILK